MANLFRISVLVSLCVVAISCKNSSKEQKVESKPAAKVEKAKSIDMGLYFQSALEGGIANVQEALENGVDVNTPDENNRTALMLASFNGHVDIVSLLIEKGANVNAIDNTKRSALMFASTGPFNETVKVLLDAGAEVNLADGEENWTAVMFASAEGQLDVLKTLVAHGGDLTMVDVDGESCMDFASSKGHAAVVGYLKEAN